MLTKRVIPCLDVRDGRIVKGVGFSNLRDAGDPAERAELYERDGADELIILDVSATPEGRATAAATVAAVRRVIGIPLTVGGGVRRVADAEALLAAGADKVAVNTAAVARPGLVGELASCLGVQCVVLAIDAARRRNGDAGWEVVTHSGATRTGLDAPGWAQAAEAAGAGEILLTSWDEDGRGGGYDLGLISAVASRVAIPVVASGGASNSTHMLGAFAAGAEAVLAASIFHDGATTVAHVKSELAQAGMEMRL
jgi:imidazoleglycerol phosphate synthase cyclase subunit